jgi:glutathione S-transferase
MLEHKQMEYELANVMPGSQPVVLRLAGFRGRTVPALKLNGHRFQGSVQIARALESAKPQPELYPGDPEQRRAVEEAEAWGERELQPLPRRFFRWGMAHDGALRRGLTELQGIPAPGVASTLLTPVAYWFVHLSRATDDNTRAGLAELPAKLDHVDELIAAGTIGRPGEPNAADFQIASSVNVLHGFADLRDVIGGRPAAELAGRLFPRPIAELPPYLPADWLAPLRS